MPPIGWYLAQGMIPLGEDSSDDDEGPAELPDGRLVCGPHGRVVCHRCCVDFSFMEERFLRSGSAFYDAAFYSESDDDAFSDTEPAFVPRGESARVVDDDRKPKRGSGRVFPAKFQPPSTSVTPQELFSGRMKFMEVKRFTLHDDPRTGLIYTDGACSENGQTDPKAGWAFWHGLSLSGDKLCADGRLEKKGPFGDEAAQTSNRAELRAVIAALRFRYWPGENFRKLVIATDSEYIVEGATNWARKWAADNWTRRAAPRSRQRTDVKNKDLWLALLGEVEKYKDDGMEVLFWRIPRDWNTVADAAAKGAAASDRNAPDEWRDVMGINIGFKSLLS
ncbi:rnase h domain protein [Naviculisporaceae sp. PSN 640]